jgi:Flp pilus assembly protein TadG
VSLAGERRLRRLRRWRRDDGGSVSIEIMVLFPALLTLFLLLLQVGFWWHARAIALSAAREGVSSGRLENAPAGAGDAAARTFVANNGGGALLDWNVSEADSGERVQVTVTGQPMRILPLPGIDWAISQTAVGARERFTHPGDR